MHFLSGVKKITLLSVMVLLLLALSGCFSTPEPVLNPQPSSVKPACPLPQTKIVPEAFMEARNCLENKECWQLFDEIFARLLEIAGESPSIENNTLFKDFLKWSRNIGIISQNETKKIFHEYFNAHFWLIPDGRTPLPCNDIGGVENDLRREKLKKLQGFRCLYSENSAEYGGITADIKVFYARYLDVIEAECKYLKEKRGY